MKRKQVHKFDTIIAMTLAAIISGAESWYDIEDFGIKKQAWLGQFLELSEGIPSHDTFNRFFARQTVRLWRNASVIGYPL